MQVVGILLFCIDAEVVQSTRVVHNNESHPLIEHAGQVRFDILPSPWEHHNSPALVVMLGCKCPSSALRALEGHVHLWEIIFSYIPVTVIGCLRSCVAALLLCCG